MALTPVDPERCQAEKGGAFTLGPGLMRCTKKATVVVEEKEPGEDGERGAMSLCDGCLDVFRERMPKGKHSFIPVGDWEDLAGYRETLSSALSEIRASADTGVSEGLFDEDEAQGTRDIADALERDFTAVLDEVMDLRAMVRSMEVDL
jgi:hypothetical protein